MTNGAAPRNSLLWVGLAVLVVLSGLCSIFALVVTVAEAWQERAEAGWPEATAQVVRCSLDRSSTGQRKRLHIHCRLSYAAGTEPSVANVYSRYVPMPDVWQYPPNQIEPFAAWVDEHPPGTPIAVRYDPVNHQKVVLPGDSMPGGGPRTPDNVKVLELFAGSFFVLLALAAITRPRSLTKSEESSDMGGSLQ